MRLRRGRAARTRRRDGSNLGAAGGPSPAREVDREILDAIAADSGGYPFFLSLWGEALFDAMAAAQAVVAGTALYEEAKQAVDARRAGFYCRRFEEIERMGLLCIAAAVADAFGDAERLDARVIRTTITHARPAYGDADYEAEAFNTLVELGYVWRPPGDECLRRGRTANTRTDPPSCRRVGQGGRYPTASRPLTGVACERRPTLRQLREAMQPQYGGVSPTP